MTEKLLIFVLGGPGSGKGTLCNYLKEEYNFDHLSAGDLLREEQTREGSEHGRLIEQHIREGTIVPMEITIALLKEAMKRSSKKRILIDGFPRKLDQAYAFEQEQKGDFTLVFKCSEEVMSARLLGRGVTSGRIDDNEISIKKRFETFERDTKPVIEYFQKTNRVIYIDAEKEIETVRREVIRELERKNILPSSVGASPSL